MEEKEALAIQQRIAQQLEEADFGLDFITHLKVVFFLSLFPYILPNVNILWLQESDKVVQPKSSEQEKITVDLSQLSKRGKLDLLKKESPELLELIDDFKRIEFSIPFLILP